jgi:hypothetical protein
MQPWFEFYAVIGGAAAALLGLLFVTISINAAATLGVGHENSRRLAEQAFQNYLFVVLISLLALFPDMTAPTFGLVILCVTALRIVWMFGRLYLTVTRPTDNESRLHAFRRHLLSLVGFAMLTVAAARMALNDGDNRNLFAIATITLLFSATEVSWILLLRLGRANHAR